MSLTFSRCLLAGGVLVVAACGSEPSADPPQPPQAQVADSIAPEPAAAPEPEAFLAVDGEGIRVFVAESGSARPLPFGADREQVVAVAEQLIGSSTDAGSSADCGVDYVAFEDGFSLWFSGNRFVGWSLRGPGGKISTAGGIGIGSSRLELEDTYDVTVRPSSLGEEFSAGGLAGLLDSAGPDGRVSHLWAGQTCIAR